MFLLLGACPAPPAPKKQAADSAAVRRPVHVHPVQKIPHKKDSSAMMVVPAGSFWMGTRESHPDLPHKPPGAKPLRPHDVLLARAEPAWRHADERPRRSVTLTASFALDRQEVTNGQYTRFLRQVRAGGDGPWRHPDQPAGKDHTPRYWKDYNPLLADATYARTAPFTRDTFKAPNKPVVGVDWFDAHAYCRWAGKALPTEAQWEKACRGTDGRRWPWGNRWRWGLCNTGGEKAGADIRIKGKLKDGYIYPAPAGSFPKGRSAYGCDDMAGNVAEWVADWYAAGYYAAAPAKDPRGPARGTHRVIRGGNSQNSPSQVRCAARNHFEPEYRAFNLGFRCARGM